MTLRITTSEAVSTITDLIKRVRENGDAFIVEDAGREVCAITPIDSKPVQTVGEFLEFLKSLPPVDEEYLSAVSEHVKTANEPKIPESRWES